MRHVNDKRRKYPTVLKWAACVACIVIIIVPVLFSSNEGEPAKASPDPPRFFQVKKFSIRYKNDPSKSAEIPSPAATRTNESGGSEMKTVSETDLKAYFKSLLEENNGMQDNSGQIIEASVQSYKSIYKRLEHIETADASIRPLVLKARQALDQFNLILAEELLLEITGKQSEAIEQTRATLQRQRMEVAKFNSDIGDLKYARLDYANAKKQYRRAADSIPEQSAPFLATIQQKLGDTAFALGEFNEAKEYFQRALDIRKACFGNDYAAVSDTLKALALTFQALGQYGDAEKRLREIIKEEKSIHGSDWPEMAEMLCRLAFVVQAQGRLREAEGIFREVVAVDEKTIGPEHPDHAMHLNLLAATVQAQGRLGEAESLYRKAITIHKEKLGFRHPEAAIILNNMAGLAGAQKQFDLAEVTFLQALSIDENSVGRNHPQYVKHLNNLAALFQGQGRYEEAEALYRKAEGICVAILGSDHHQSRTIRRNLNILLSLKNNAGKQVEGETN